MRSNNNFVPSHSKRRKNKTFDPGNVLKVKNGFILYSMLVF